MGKGSKARRTGLVYVYLGKGEGKTMAAIGHAIRAVGHGKKVAIIHFMKGMRSGEYKFLKSVKNVSVYLRGPPFFLVKDKGREEHLLKAKKAFELATKILKENKYDLVILDEILYALKFGLLTEDGALSLLDHRGRAHLILTGRGASKRVLDRADVVTRTRDIKHHYHLDKRTVKVLDY